MRAGLAAHRASMQIPWSLISLAATVSGLCVLLSCSWAKGQEPPDPTAEPPPVASSPYADCPPLPEQGPEGQVTVYVAKIPAQPGFVCARAVNGIPPSLSYSISYREFRLQQHDGEQFRDFTEPMPLLPPGVIIGETLAHIGVMPGHWFDRQFPSFSPAPAGRYRACFRYTLSQSPERHEACSEEFSVS